MYQYDSSRIEVDIRNPHETLYNNTPFTVEIESEYYGQHIISILGVGWVIELNYSIVLRDASSFIMRCDGMELSTYYTFQHAYKRSNGIPITAEWILGDDHLITYSDSLRTRTFRKYTEEYLKLERFYKVDDLNGYVIQRRNDQLTIKRLHFVIPENYDTSFNFIETPEELMDLVGQFVMIPTPGLETLEGVCTDLIVN